ncbi:MAG: radical SAM protein [Acidobacteria bacterium]|nr:radical SAM protein [Acidobacteriota bacterium]
MGRHQGHHAVATSRGAPGGKRGRLAEEERLKALLVNPYQVDLVQKKGRIYTRTWTPLDLAYSAAVLEREGVEASILDANAERLSPSEVAARARGFDKVFVTSTSLDRWQCPHLDLVPFLRTVHALNDAVAEVYVMGSHGTVKPAEMLAETGARAVVRGEPEAAVLALCGSAPLAEVAGISWQDGSTAVHNPDQKPVNMETLPLPAFDRLPMERYNYELLGRHFTLFEMSRGCASNCTFCLLKTYGTGVRKKSVDKLAREVEYGIKNFGVKTAYFMDLEFTVLRKQVVEFCQHLIRQQYDFTWCCQTRLDLVDDELLGLMKRAGCRLIHAGVEAGSENMLKLVDKDITMREIEQGMARIHKAGIETACFFMMGFPESGHRDMEDIVRFARKLAPTYALFHIAAPYPGTKLYDQVKSDPNVRFSDGSLFPEAIEGRFSLPELKHMTRKAYLGYYLRPGYVGARLAKGEFRALASQMWLFLQFVRS